MSALTGRVAIVTGAGRGLGREHALLLAAEGAMVVVNDLAGREGEGSPADDVVNEIREFGGEAVANTDSVSSWAGARKLVETAVQTFNDLHIVVNNAGIMRDKTMIKMTEQEFDSVVEVNLKGTFAVSRHAAEYWRNQSKQGVNADRSIINTASAAGLAPNVGQANYASAKAGIAAMTVVAAKELARYGVRVNAIAPAARTTLTLNTPGLSEQVAKPEDEGDFDRWHPGNISPLVGYLASEDCQLTEGTFRIVGDLIGVYEGWHVVDTHENGERWTLSGIHEAIGGWKGEAAEGE